MSAIARGLRPAAAALSFLTRIPIGSGVDLRSEDVTRAALYFPLVGAALGAGVGLVAVGLDGVLTVLLAAALAVAADAVLTGAIHFDALADAADALGARDRARALEIMREPTIGSFGGLALVVGVVLKVGAIAALLAEDDALLVLVAAYALGRAAPLALGWWLPYARTGAGSGRTVTEGAAWEKGGGLLLAAGVAAAAVGLQAAYLGLGAGLAVLLVGVLSSRCLGGVTGDVLGAGVELATTGALLAAVASA